LGDGILLLGCGVKSEEGRKSDEKTPVYAAGHDLAAIFTLKVRSGKGEFST
jgi:hypothetical protein